MSISALRRVKHASGCPTVRPGIISPASVKIINAGSAAPEDCFTTGPNCCVTASRGWCVHRGCSCPAVGVRIISSASVRTGSRKGNSPSPNNHFAAGPHRSVIRAGNWCISCAGGRPTIRTRIVSAAGVKIVSVVSAPHDRLSSGPDRRMILSAIGGVGSAGQCPAVTSASRPSDIFGSVYLALDAAFSLGLWFSATALQDVNGSLS